MVFVSYKEEERPKNNCINSQKTTKKTASPAVSVPRLFRSVFGLGIFLQLKADSDTINPDNVASKNPLISGEQPSRTLQKTVQWETV